jgi:formiminotetrahydrofolate cyclodeaminase
MYLEGPMAGFIDRLASSSPEPGGGAASAAVAALGAALVSMVANLTVGKDKYADVQDRVAGLLESSEKIRLELQDLLQEDTEVYRVLAAAFKMPRETDEEKEKRNEAVQSALREATAVPFAIAEKCLVVAELSEIAADIGNMNAVSDAGVAALLAESGAQCAALNVKINLNSINDKDFVQEKWEAIKDILSRAEVLREKVVKVTYEKLG